MQLNVRLFATLREVLGASQVSVELPEGASVRDFTSAFKLQFPQVRDLPGARVSVNYEYVDDDVLLHPSDEIALIPPVSGGRNAFYEITPDEITADSVSALVASPDHGAITVFLGTSRRMSRGREVAYLEYEAYPEMAIRKLEQIGAEIQERWGTDRIAIRHRVGRVDLGVASVAIAVATEHRAEGFAACQYAIDRLKEIVPIWKKEVWVGGGEWIGWDCAVDPFASPPPSVSATGEPS
jgi:MoaE-MoaD fusion protein